MKTQRLMKVVLGAFLFLTCMTGQTQAQTKDIVDLAAGNENLSTLWLQ